MSNLHEKGQAVMQMELLENRALFSTVVHSEYELSVARQTQAVVVGQDIYFIGTTYDREHQAYRNTVDVLNTQTGNENAYTQLETGSAYNIQALGPPNGGAMLVGDYIINGAAESFNVDADTFSFQTPPAEVSENGGVALAGDSLVYAGGVQVGNIGLSGPDNAVSIFNGATGQWSQGTPLPDYRQPFADSLDNLALFIGATPFYYHLGFVDSNDIDIYNGSTGRWSHQSLASPITEFAIANVGHEAIFAGGDAPLITEDGIADATHSASSEVDIYNDQTNQVTQAQLSLARDEIATATVGNTAIFAGGRYFKNDNSRYYYENTVDLYNASTNTWSTAHLSTLRHNARSVVAGNVALFYGGETRHPLLMDVYNAATNQWSTTDLPIIISHPQTVTIGHDILFYSASTPTLEIYNTETNTWGSTLLSAARSEMGVAVLNNQVFFGGGLGVSSESNVVDVFTFNNDVLS